jgi:glycerol kinase
VPALVGLGAPWWRRAARAAWLGMGVATSRGDLVAAAYQGIACRVAQVVTAMSGALASAARPAAGTEIDRLRVDGGLTGSRPLMQAVADLTGMDVAISAEPEATAAGAAALAARGAGIWRDDAPIHARVATSAVVEPRMSADERADRLARFDAAVALVSRFE